MDDTSRDCVVENEGVDHDENINIQKKSEREREINNDWLKMNRKRRKMFNLSSLFLLMGVCESF